jgi:hypothetical protein
MNDPLEGFNLIVADHPIEVKNFRGKVFSPAISVAKSGRAREREVVEDLVSAVRMDMQGVNPIPAPGERRGDHEKEWHGHTSLPINMTVP